MLLEDHCHGGFGLTRGHVRYSTVGSARRMPEEVKSGITKADANVDDSNAAAFGKPRMLGGSLLDGGLLILNGLHRKPNQINLTHMM
jgi:hypothetical protein